jgi:hypothetical protein
MSKGCQKWYLFLAIVFKFGVKEQTLRYFFICNPRVISEGRKGGGKCADKIPSAHNPPSRNLKAVDQWESQAWIVPLLSLAGGAQYSPPPCRYGTRRSRDRVVCLMQMRPPSPSPLPILQWPPFWIFPAPAVGGPSAGLSTSPFNILENKYNLWGHVRMCTRQS